MRRRTVIVPILLLAAALVARRRRRARLAAPTPLAEPAAPAPVALLPPAPRFVSVPWTLAAAPPDLPELTIRFACDERMELDRLDAQETPTQVFVTVLMRWRPSAGGLLARRNEREAVVALGRPLGARELVHAPVDLDASGDAPGEQAGEEPSGPPLYP